MATKVEEEVTGLVLEDLTEDECYLLAILADHSGLDLAEFAWYDPDNPDGCWRAWPFQWKWFRDDHHHQIDQCGRAVGKTTSIVIRMYAFPFLWPGSEAVVTAPELVHLEPLTDLIEYRFMTGRLGREMLPRGRGAVTHRPFMMNFVNGARIIGRIPQRDGKGVKGIHPRWLELDEAQDYPKDGWTELTSTLKRGIAGAMWRAHGVTRGVRDTFYEHTQENPDSIWRVHRITQMHRPNWTDEEREDNIQMFGSRDAPDYRRNVLGLHGDATNPLFVLHRLMACVDENVTSDYNVNQYHRTVINDEMLKDRGVLRSPVEFLDLPDRRGYNAYWCGMDVGYTKDPSEILIFGQFNKKDEAALRLIGRVHLDRMAAPQQGQLVAHIVEHFRPIAFSMDKTGNGLPLFQYLQHDYPDIAAQIKGYNFSENILVDFDDNIVEKLPEGADDVKEAGIKKRVLEYATDKLREYVDRQLLELPWDKELIGEFQGQTYTYKASMDMYGRPRRVFSQGNFHALDAARMAALGFAQHKIETMMELRKQVDDRPVFDFFVTI